MSFEKNWNTLTQKDFKLSPHCLDEVNGCLAELSEKVNSQEDSHEDPKKKAESLLQEIENKKLSIRDRDEKKKELYKMLIVNKTTNTATDKLNIEDKLTLKRKFIEILKKEFNTNPDALNFLDPTSYDNADILSYYQGVDMDEDAIRAKTITVLEWLIIENKSIKHQDDHFTNKQKMGNMLSFVYSVLQLTQEESKKTDLINLSKQYIQSYPLADKIEVKEGGREWSLSVGTLEVNGITSKEKNELAAILLVGENANICEFFEWEPRENDLVWANSVIDNITKQHDLSIYTVWDNVYLYNSIDKYKVISKEEFDLAKKEKELWKYVQEMWFDRWGNQQEVEEKVIKSTEPKRVIKKI